MISVLALVSIAVAATSALATPPQDCPPNLVSCTPAARDADPCCVPRAGLWLFKQRFDPESGDNGKWGINGVDIRECDGSEPKQASNEKMTSEEIGSRCARAGFDADLAERAWVPSESGESVEEMWERVWNTDGRFVSSICDGDPSRFFRALDELHSYLRIGEWLEAAGITPAEDVRYRLADITMALSPDSLLPVVLCNNATLEAVVYPVSIISNLERFVAAGNQKVLVGNCPQDGIIYPPSAVLPTPTSAQWDPIFRPTMRPITLSHDESRMVKYPEDDDDQVMKKLAFFKRNDAHRMAGEHGHDEL